MKIYLRNLWEKLQESYWAVPALMMALAIGFASFTLALDERVDISALKGFEWTHIKDSAGARTLLSTIASSMITVAGVVFSITIVALTLASSQFGSRLIRSFMRDRNNQFALGAFIATFIYCLLILRQIPGTGQGFIPYISVACGVLLALTSIAVLIYYIHHVAASIQAENVIAAVTAELDAAIDRLFPRSEAQQAEDIQSAALPADFIRQAASISAIGRGYIQAIDIDSLVRIAADHDIVIVLETCPGRFMIEGACLASYWPGATLTTELCQSVNATLILGDQPTPEQNVSYLIERLVEVAVRALSPGLNDPFTAITCIDYLGAALGKLMQRTPPSPYHYDSENRLRLIIPQPAFGELIGVAFDQIRHYGRSDSVVLSRILDTLTLLAPLVRHPAHSAALRKQAELVMESAKQHLPEQYEQEIIIARHQQMLDILQSFEFK